MFGSVLSSATGFLDKRFVLNLFLPSAAFWGGLMLLAMQGDGWTAAEGWWVAQSGTEQLLSAGAAVSALTVFAFLMAGQVTSLTRLWAGCWTGSLGARLSAPLSKWQNRRWAQLDLDQDDDYMTRFYEFPVSKQDTRPTRLGNVLRAAEEYSGDAERYGMQSGFYWPRLYLVLPEETRTLVEDFRSALDRMVFVASLAVAFPVAALGVLVLADTSWAAWGLSTLIALLVAVAAYRGAVRSAHAFGDVLRACFDLYRRRLIRQFGLVVPPTLDAERTIWGTLMQQLYTRAADDPSLLVWDIGGEE